MTEEFDAGAKARWLSEKNVDDRSTMRSGEDEILVRIDRVRRLVEFVRDATTVVRARGRLVAVMRELDDLRRAAEATEERCRELRDEVDRYEREEHDALARRNRPST